MSAALLSSAPTCAYALPSAADLAPTASGIAPRHAARTCSYQQLLSPLLISRSISSSWGPLDCPRSRAQPSRRRGFCSWLSFRPARWKYDFLQLSELSFCCLHCNLDPGTILAPSSLSPALSSQKQNILSGPTGQTLDPLPTPRCLFSAF